MNSYLKIFLLPLLILLTACSPKPLENEDFPYSKAQLEKLKSLNKDYQTLSEMQGIDAALYLNKVDFTDIVNNTFTDFTQHFTRLDAPAFSKPSFGRIKIDLKDQKISSRVNFSFEADSLKREIFGHLSAKHTLQAGKNKFIIFQNQTPAISVNFKTVRTGKFSSGRNKHTIITAGILQIRTDVILYFNIMILPATSKSLNHFRHPEKPLQ